MGKIELMGYIERYRAEARSAALNLQAVYASIPPGTVVSYTRDQVRCEGKILSLAGAHAVWVRELTSQKEIKILCDSIDSIVRLPGEESQPDRTREDIEADIAAAAAEITERFGRYEGVYSLVRALKKRLAADLAPLDKSIMTIDKALRNPQGFVDGMEEI